MNYSYLLEKNISDIVSINSNWYVANSAIWGERYMKEKEGILTQRRNIAEIKIITKYLPKQCKKILDAPCGYGRIANGLAIKGFNVTGIDISRYFIKIAKKEAKKRGLDVYYITGNILKKNVRGKFDAVLNVFTSLGYLESEEKNELFIKKICGYVRIGGRLIIETINPIATLSHYKGSETVELKDGTKLHFQRFFNVKTATSITKISEVKGKKSQELVHVIRLYFPHELINICSGFGFKIVALLNQQGVKKDIKNSPRMWLIFEKSKKS